MMYTSVKRVCDFLIAAIILILLLPISFPIIIFLRLTGEGEILYLQERIGYKNKKFYIWKFATMLKDSPNMSGGLITLKKDPRLTPMGDFLRKTKINELPQLVNVLCGDMSFVGPRPVMQKSFEQYPEDVKNVIYNVKPGITGVGSIIFRNEEELITREKEKGNDPWEFYRTVIYPYKGEVEKWYQANQSFQTDLAILILTAWVVIFPNSNALYKYFEGLPVNPLGMDKV
ncbi:sugar transferase [Desulfosediminicola ganghwensis]|uniref:sugar transferase n=1 Tax=Desulfosediminicola ganghwensis TaxID=2569540 RepID=UPI001C3E372D|nr:sugar transferase [Desulfosediminicola ganghwensis]